MKITIDTEQVTALDLYLWKSILELFERQVARETQADSEQADSEQPKRRGRPKKSADHLRVVDPEPQPEPQAPEAAPAAPEEPAAEIGVDDVRAALRSYTTAHGMPAGVALLSRYNATRISDLDPGRFREFVRECGA